MEKLIEEIITYGTVTFLILIVIVIYLLRKKKASKIVSKKIEKAKLEGLHEPVSLHPVIDIGSCIQTGACISACPEQDILGIQDGKATTINASHCIGHGACFHACPTEAITLCIGTEKRGIELPHVNYNFETNIHGIYIAGELGGMGLIRNAVEQGKQAVENIAKTIKSKHQAEYDIVIVGAGPAGISAALSAKERKLNFIILEQDTLGGTVFTFPRSKIVMTQPMNLALMGKIKLSETSKLHLLSIWNTALDKYNISIEEHCKVEEIKETDGYFTVGTNNGKHYTTSNVVLAIGRRGTPRKLNVPGENSEKVAYRLLEPEEINGKNILVVGGGDSAIESAMMLADNNNVTISYRKDIFQRIKPKNKERINNTIQQNKVQVRFNTTVKAINKDDVILSSMIDKNEEALKNDLVYIFAGGELPTQFLKKIGLNITKKYGEALLKHK